MNKLTVLHVRVEEEPEVITVENSLEHLKRLVGGWFEIVSITDDIIMVVNEEGAIDELPINFITAKKEVSSNTFGIQLLHEVHGDVFFVSTLSDEFHSLDKPQIQKVKRMFNHSRGMLTLNE